MCLVVLVLLVVFWRFSGVLIFRSEISRRVIIDRDDSYK